VPRAGELADLLEPDGGRVKRRADHAQSRGRRRGGLDGGHHLLLKQLRAPEQHLALVREIAEERPLGKPRAFRDLRDRCLVIPALAV